MVRLGDTVKNTICLVLSVFEAVYALMGIFCCVFERFLDLPLSDLSFLFWPKERFPEAGQGFHETNT